MSEELIDELRERADALCRITHAPSQSLILFHLLGTGRVMAVKEIAEEVGFTHKATERAVAKLLKKGLIQRTSFRNGAYVCDAKYVLLCLLHMATCLYEDIEEYRNIKTRT